MPRTTVAQLEERFNRFKELVDAKMNERLAAKIAGLTDDEVRQALGIHADTELTDRVVMTGIVQQVGKATRGAENANERATRLERRLGALEEALASDELVEALVAGMNGGRKSFIQSMRERKVTDADIRRVLLIVDDVQELDLSDEQLFYELYSAHTVLHDRVDHVETRVTRLEETREDGGHIPPLGWLVAIVVWLVVWFFVWVAPYGVHGNVHDDSGKAVGTFEGGWHAGWLGFFLGLLAGGFVLMSSRSYGRSSVTTEETNEVHEDHHSDRSSWFWRATHGGGNRTVERRSNAPERTADDTEVITTTPSHSA